MPGDGLAGLDVPQGLVDAGDGEKLLVCARLAELAAVQNVDAVRMADGGEAVGDDDRGAVDRNALERPLDGGLGFIVDRRRSFVEHQNRGIGEYGACLLYTSDAADDLVSV